jgi:hypothetical protein
MRFLYCGWQIPLEHLCDKWHFMVPCGFPNWNQLTALVCKHMLA